MFQRILVPLDGTDLAEHAIHIAARIARATGGKLVFVRVVLPPVEFGTFTASRAVVMRREAFERRLTQANGYLTRDLALNYANDLAGVSTEVEVVSGAPAPTIFTEARLLHTDLIVMCSRGEGSLKRWIFGSVAHEAVRHSPVPVLILKERCGNALRWDGAHPMRALVALDGSSLAEAALAPTAQLIAALAAPGQGALHLLRVALRPIMYGRFSSNTLIDHYVVEQEQQEAMAYLSDLADRLHRSSLADGNLAISWSVIAGSDVAEALNTLAAAPTHTLDVGQYDLIAMATHGRHGPHRLVMGSVTEQVLNAAKLPLLIVRPEEAAVPREAKEKEVSSVG